MYCSLQWPCSISVISSWSHVGIAIPTKGSSSKITMKMLLFFQFSHLLIPLIPVLPPHSDMQSTRDIHLFFQMSIIWTNICQTILSQANLDGSIYLLSSSPSPDCFSMLGKITSYSPSQHLRCKAGCHSWSLFSFTLHIEFTRHLQWPYFHSNSYMCCCIFNTLYCSQTVDDPVVSNTKFVINARLVDVTCLSQKRGVVVSRMTYDFWRVFKSHGRIYCVLCFSMSPMIKIEALLSARILKNRWHGAELL